MSAARYRLVALIALALLSSACFWRKPPPAQSPILPPAEFKVDPALRAPPVQESGVREPASEQLPDYESAR